MGKRNPFEKKKKKEINIYIQNTPVLWFKRFLLQQKPVLSGGSKAYAPTAWFPKGACQ